MPFSDDVSLRVRTAHHDLVDEVDNRRGRLLRLELREYVALVVGLVGRLSRDESEAAAAKNKDST